MNISKGEATMHDETAGTGAFFILCIAISLAVAGILFLITKAFLVCLVVWFMMSCLTLGVGSWIMNRIETSNHKKEP